MNRHLVTVEIGVESCRYQWVKLDSFPLDHLRLECLNTKSVKRRRTVQKNWVSFHHILQNIIYNRFFSVDNSFRRFYRFYDSSFYQFSDNERLIKLCCHILRNTALMKLKLWPYDDNRTRRVIHPFT